MLRHFLRIAIGAAVALLLVRAFVVEGLFLPQRIASGSMAPALLGPHQQRTCPECRFQLRTALVGGQAPATACPRCGSQIPGAPAVVLPGRRVLIDRASWRLRPPRRFEIAAYRGAPGEPSPQVKRIVGLPGETIAIRGGDLFVNGERLVKTPAEQRQVAIAVHDDRSIATDGSSRLRWSAASNSAWERLAGGWTRAKQPAAADRLSTDWLALQVPAGASCVYDDYTYNVELSRSLQCVDDLMLTCRVACQGEGTLSVRVQFAGSASLFNIHPQTGKLAVIEGSQVVSHSISDRAAAAIRRLGTGAELTVSTFDGRLLLAIDNHIVFRAPLADAGDEVATGEPFALAAKGLEVLVQDLRLWRDIYYLPPPSGGFGDPAVELPADGYFMLGDNSPVSRDCRDAAIGPCIRANQLLGRVLAPPTW